MLPRLLTLLIVLSMLVIDGKSTAAGNVARDGSDLAHWPRGNPQLSPTYGTGGGTRIRSRGCVGSKCGGGGSRTPTPARTPSMGSPIRVTDVPSPNFQSSLEPSPKSYGRAKELYGYGRPSRTSSEHSGGHSPAQFSTGSGPHSPGTPQKSSGRNTPSPTYSSGSPSRKSPSGAGPSGTKHH